MQAAEYFERHLVDMNELDQLWLTEFGNRREWAMRCVVIAAAALGIWLYSGLWLVLVWALAYFASLGFKYAFLRPTDGQANRSGMIGVGSYVATAAIFISLPLYLMTTGDIVLSFCGICGVVALAVFSLLREEPPKVVEPIDIAVGWVVVLVAGITYVPMSDSLAAQAVMALLCVIVGIYYTMALITTRANRAVLREAAQRGMEAQKMEAIGRLSGGIAHDFNNILTALQGSLELYHELPEGADRDALVQEAQVAGSRATGLVAQLLSFARRAPLKARPVDAGGLLEDLGTLAKRLLPDTIQLELRRPAAPVEAFVDAESLHAALLNLLLNARDAIEGDGHIIMAVDVTEGAASDAGITPTEDFETAHVCFSVCDNGPGMSPQMMDRALEPFFTTKPPGSGSGLGLPMAKGFAEQSGGAFRMRSSENGTTVTLHLPIAP